MEISARKTLRLKDYDYSQNGAYFITVCTQNRYPFFAVGVDRCVRPAMGYEIVERWLKEIPEHFEYAAIDKYSIMPEHIHFILRIDRPIGEGGHAGPPLHKILQWFKTMTTNEYTKSVKRGLAQPYNKRLWQRGYCEHIIRNDEDYIECMKYIEENPIKKSLDA